MYDNDYIADQFSLLSKLMDIHGENSFKIKSYSIAAFALEKLTQPIAEMPPTEMTSIKGIGDAIGKKIGEILQTGELPLLRKYIDNTPPGVIQMLKIKGLGPKKIATIWKEMEIETIGELLYACQENRLMLYKGFGEKTQAGVQTSIEFFMRSQGNHLYKDVEAFVRNMETMMAEHFKGNKVSVTGTFRRQMETIAQLQWVTTIGEEALKTYLEGAGYTADSPSQYRGPEGIKMEFLHTTPENFATTLFQTSGSEEFLTAWQNKTKWNPDQPYGSEEDIFQAHSIQYIPSCLRERSDILEQAAAAKAPDLIQVDDIKGIIHSHSDWSDGSNTLEQMARACIAKGYEYLVISDHSKSAGYANGLKEDRIKQQHELIDELNKKLAPFVIFKSIEADILADGALDYTDNILSTFDLVIASVHSNLKMTEDKAMTRLLQAISNPYTTILGHMTGRLLLSRPGYPVDHKAIIDACVTNKVVIEINAHPRRLDIDWRWIPYALEKGALLSIDPDAHFTEGYNDVKYGVLAAQKGGLTAARNLSSFTLAQLQRYLAERKKSRGI